MEFVGLPLYLNTEIALVFLFFSPSLKRNFGAVRIDKNSSDLIVQICLLRKKKLGGVTKFLFNSNLKFI